jgi:sirohydrochlorin ferrochelatase
MKALLLIAHGSRRKSSNDEVIALSEAIALDIKDKYPIVRAGFLELVQPSITEAIDNCVQLGANEVCVVPFFLSKGRHVFEDVPREVNKAREIHGEVSIIITPHVGESPEMKGLIRDLVMSNDLST